MAPILLWLILILCLLISAVKYLMGIIMRFSFPSTKARKDYTYEPDGHVLDVPWRQQRCRLLIISLRASVRAIIPTRSSSEA